MTVNITGGTLTSRNNAAIAVYRLERVDGQWTTNENTKIVSYLAALTVSGGNFSAGSKKDAFETVSYTHLSAREVYCSTPSAVVTSATIISSREPTSPLAFCT